MALRIICMCGYVIQGDDDEELWKNARGHMGVLHPELVGNVTREDLLLDVWHYRNANVETRTVDIHIVGLRRKVEPDPAKPTLIQTVRGKGYRWYS